jgi:tRNA threonylcarbamoyladenosine modification (KEOPS) complex Cgi121 subunit
MDVFQRIVKLMLFTVNLGREQEWKYYVGICGFRGCPIGNDIEKLLDRVRALHSDQPLLAIQFFDADKIATYLHLLASAVHALQSFKISRNISKSVGTESLLYASAQRQISDAINKVGLKVTSQNVAVNLVGSQSDMIIKSMEKVRQELGGQADDSVLGIRDLRKTEVIMRTFEISDIELEAAKAGVDIGQVERAVTKRILSKMSIMALSK